MNFEAMSANQTAYKELNVVTLDYPPFIVAVVRLNWDIPVKVKLIISIEIVLFA